MIDCAPGQLPQSFMAVSNRFMNAKKFGQFQELSPKSFAALQRTSTTTIRMPELVIWCWSSTVSSDVRAGAGSLIYCEGVIIS